MVSTLERGSYFAFTRGDHRHPSAAGNCEEARYNGAIDGEYDELPPSRSSSFKSVSSSTSAFRRIGVVSENQLDTLQRRLVNHDHVTSPSASVSHRGVPDDPLSAVRPPSYYSPADCPPTSNNHFQRMAPPTPPRRPVVPDRCHEMPPLFPEVNVTSAPAISGDRTIQQTPGLDWHSTSAFSKISPSSVDRPMPLKQPHSHTNGYRRSDYTQVLHNRPNVIRSPLESDTVDSQARSLSTTASIGSPDVLEYRLAERDAELRTLRETMEHNEWAILRVLEDQRQRSDTKAAEQAAEWRKQMGDLSARAAMERRSLSDTIRQLAVENRKLRSSLSAARNNLERQQLELRCGTEQESGPAAAHTDATPAVFSRQDSVLSDRWSTATTSSRRDDDGQQTSYATKSRREGWTADDRSLSTSSAGGQSIYAFLSECFAGTLKKSSSRHDEPNNGDDRRRCRSSPLVVDMFDKNRRSRLATTLTADQRTNINGVCQLTSSTVQNASECTDDVFQGSLVDETQTCPCCDELREQLEQQRRVFESEKKRWLSEKDRVVEYQKLLQVGYVQLVKRCEALEKQLHRQTVDDDSGSVNCSSKPTSALRDTLTGDSRITLPTSDESVC